jgi:hypothetical protein
MLQRGFGTKRGRDHHVWVYKKGLLPKQTSTKKFGVEKHFYGPENSEADIKITSYENESQSILQEVRKLPNGVELDKEFVATLISHLEIRTAFLRREFSEMLQSMLSGLSANLLSPDAARKIMITYLKDNPEELDKWLGQAFIHPDARAGFADIAHQLVQTMPDAEIIKISRPYWRIFQDLCRAISEIG